MAKNIPISFKDVDLAETVFNTDMPTCKGRSTSSCVLMTSNGETIQLPAELQHKGRKFETVINVVYINYQNCLHSVDQKIKLKLMTALRKIKKGESYDAALLYKCIKIQCGTAINPKFIFHGFMIIMSFQKVWMS